MDKSLRDSAIGRGVKAVDRLLHLLATRLERTPRTAPSGRCCSALPSLCYSTQTCRGPHPIIPLQVDMLYGRRVKGVPDASRWIESYTVRWGWGGGVGGRREWGGRTHTGEQGGLG